MLGLLLIGVLIWWISRHRRSSFDDSSRSMPAGQSTDSKGPTPALIERAVPVPLRPPHPSYPSSMPSPTPTSNSTGNAENSATFLVQHAPWALGHPGTSTPYPYGTTGIGPTFTLPSMLSSSSVGQPSTEPQQKGGSRSMIARFVFPSKRTKRVSDTPSALSQGSSKMSQMESPLTNVEHLPPLTSSSPDPGPISGPSLLNPAPYIQRPVSQISAPSSGGSTSNPWGINPPGYTSPEATIFPSTTYQPISAIQAHTNTAFQYQH